MQLREFTNRKIVSVEKEKRQHKEAVDYEGTESSLRRSQATEFMDWLKTVLAGRCWGVKTTSRLESHPCVITVEEMGAARHFVHTQFTQYPKRPDTHFCSHSWKLIQGVWHVWTSVGSEESRHGSATILTADDGEGDQRIRLTGGTPAAGSGQAGRCSCRRLSGVPGCECLQDQGRLP
ncbi:uncharacterized protein [Procambarus clarkii]|uniref:uncharacterized protein n=1 Tax=Procambarus clarkii TaxID=6728 RepID=UPI0037443867